MVAGSSDDDGAVAGRVSGTGGRGAPGEAGGSQGGPGGAADDGGAADTPAAPGRFGTAGSETAGGRTAGSDLPEVQMWTDGACKGNPGVGGWGVLMRSGTHERELRGGEASTTNNQMELTAVIEGLRALKRRARVTLHVDSVYVMKGMQEWIATWKRNGWRTAAKKPVKNAEMWRELDDQA